MPTLTAEEIAQLKKEKTRAESAAATFTAQIAAQQARAAELLVADNAFKKFFSYYNDDIIGKYDAERKALDGQYIASPLVEADITSCANLEGGRIQPAMPTTDVVRIAQFDGGPLVSTTTNENKHISDQASVETTLVSGYGGSSPSATVVTATSITPSSTTMQLTDPGSTYSLAPNDVYIITGGGFLAVVKILTFTMQTSPTPPPYVADCTIQLIVAPLGTISAGEILTAFTGFTNTERTNKVTTLPAMQPLMDYLIAQLQGYINNRKSRLDEQITAINANLDPDAVTQLATTKTNANTSKTFLTTYLLTTVISNTGLTSLSTERATRSSQITARITQIIANYTGQTENYYNRRYSVANDRASTSRGTLRLQKAAAGNSTTSQAYADSLTAQASAINNLLP